MKLTLAGVSHHKAPIELRERVALDVGACRALAERLEGEAIVLSTCNRTELYLAQEEDAEQLAVGTLAELAGDRGADLTAALYRLRDEAAALHLFRVAAGLDSLVPGEGEILGQVRTAFEVGSPGPQTLGSKVTTAASGVEQSTQARIAHPQSQNGRSCSGQDQATSRESSATNVW